MKNTYLYGFTLLEMLLAMAIFSIMNLTAYQVLRTTFKSSEIFIQKSTRLVNIQRAIGFLERDITHAIILLSGSDNFSVKSEKLYSGENSIDLIRNNRFNPAGLFPRSNLERVRYRIKNNTLERVSYRYPDNLSNDQPNVTTILRNVLDFQLKFYHRKQWIEKWDHPSMMPKGVAVILQLENMNIIRKMMILTSQEAVQ